MNEEKKTWLDRIGLIHLWATIKAALDTKVDKIPGFNLSENNYSTEDKTKLDGLSNYEHPTTPGNKHIPAGGTKDQILRWKEDGTAEWGNETPPPKYKVMTPASESSAGDSGLVPSPPVGSQNKVLRGDGTWANDENTWRPVQDNLDTDSAEDSLSAAQGKVLKGLVDSKSDKGHQHVLSDVPDLKDAATKMTRTATDITDSKFESAEADSKYVPDMAMLSNWNGAYNENGESHLQYCDQGRFGSMAKRTDTDFLELAGGTMTGALNFPNDTWNLVGDDAYMGDHNIGGAFCIMGANNTTRLALVNKDDQGDSAYMQYAGGNIYFNKTLEANISGSATSLSSGAIFNGGDGNNAGYRLIATVSINAWANYRGVFVVCSRHQGTGILSVGIGNNTSSVSQANAYAEIRYFGINGSGNAISSDSFLAYISSDGSKGYLFYKYWDYSSCYITSLSSNNFSISNGTWMSSIGSGYGSQKANTTVVSYTPTTFQTSDPGSNSGLETGRVLFVYE